MSAQNNKAVSVLLVGAGAIGSHLAQHIGRMPGIAEVILVDPDYYDLANLYHQAITLRDPGTSKVEAQARRLAEINPQLAIEPIAAAVEQVPRGLLRCDVILTCLDSRRSRQHVNLIARRLGTPWIDAGIEASGRLVRINTYFPREDNACLECQWDERDYEAIERVYACNGGRTEPAPTGAPSSLGALAASLQALELADLLSGKLAPSSPAREVVLDAKHHKVFVTTLGRNPGCRLTDHGVWQVEKLDSGPEELTLADALLLAPDGANANPANGLRVEGSRFINRLDCPECGFTKELLRLEAALGRRDYLCPDCGKELVASGFHNVERLMPTAMPELRLDRPLSEVGLRPGDLISVGIPGNEKHLEMEEAQMPSHEKRDLTYEAFMHEQYEQALALAGESDLLDLHPLSGLPPRFVAEFHCKGLVCAPGGPVHEAANFAVGIMLPSDYLRRVNPFEVLTWLDPVEIYHPNILPPRICPGRIHAGTSLVDLLYQCFEIISYQNCYMNEGNALNWNACQWARKNQSRFPVDPRPLKWKQPAGEPEELPQGA